MITRRDLLWNNVAVSMIRRQSVRLLAFLQDQWIPMLTDCRPISVSVALSQLVQGRPQDLLQWLCGRSDAPMVILFSTCHMPKEAEHQHKLQKTKIYPRRRRRKMCYSYARVETLKLIGLGTTATTNQIWLAEIVDSVMQWPVLRFRPTEHSISSSQWSSPRLITN